MNRETSIVDIFNRMSYNDGETENTDEKIRELYPDSKDVERIELLSTAERNILDSNVNKNWSEVPLRIRASILLEIGRKLSKEADKLSQLQNFREKDYSLLVDSFYYYSNVCYQLEEKWIPYGCVLVHLSSDVPLSMLGSVISAAFGAGCPVVVLYSVENPWFLFFLKHVFSHTTLPKDLFTLVPKCEANEREVESIDLRMKTVSFGNHLSAMNLYKMTWFESFSFVNLNKTATIIFESCDLSAAVDKIVYETWDKRLATAWGVSTAVVQESVYENFLNRLNSRIDQLTDEREGVLIKNCIISEKDRNRETEPNVPVLEVFSCRTAKEGVGFLNSYQYYLGTSIWSENSSQALEVASKLICSYVWINCHGIIDPRVPCPSSDNNGSVAFGGHEGILEYGVVSKTFSPVCEKEMIFVPQKIQPNIEETVLLAQKAFEKWVLMENKEMYLTEIAVSFKNQTTLANLLGLIIEVLSVKNTNPVPRSCNKNFYIIQEKIPIGVIAIIVKQWLNWEFLAYLITTAIALGNAVVLVLKESEQTFFLKSLVDVFDSHLPKGLLSVITENNDQGAEISLASNKIVQALWFDPCFAYSREYVRLIRKISSTTLKRIWSLPPSSDFRSYASFSFIFRRECTRNKIIWLTKVDHFP